MKGHMRKVISPSTRFTVFQRDGFKCRYCGRAPSDGARLTIDHVESVADNGANAITNYLTSCWTCNIGRGKASLEELTLEYNETETGKIKHDLEVSGQDRLLYIAEKLGPIAKRLERFDLYELASESGIHLEEIMKSIKKLHSTGLSFMEKSSGTSWRYKP